MKRIRFFFSFGIAALCVFVFAGGVTADDSDNLIYIKTASGSTEVPYTGVAPNVNVLVNEDTIYKSSNIRWVIWDVSQYNAYKVNIDSIINESNLAVPAIGRRLGFTGKLPILAHIQQASGGAWAVGGGAEVGYSFDAFNGTGSGGNLQWIKGVVIGELLNTIMASLTDNWPSDWWCDGVWYFPGLVAIDVAKEVVDTAFALKWESDERYPTYPVYNVMASLLKANGWGYFQTFFNLIRADSVHWGNIGTQPSKIRTDYVIAYLSIAAGKNMGRTLNDSLIKGKNTTYGGADTTEVAAIMNVEYLLKLATAQKLNVKTAWADYRAGNYAGAKTILDGLGVGVVVPARGIAAAGERGYMNIYSLDGRKLYSGVLKDPKDALPRGVYKGLTVVVYTGRIDKQVYARKMVLVNP
jgi:hypothetical protein